MTGPYTKKHITDGFDYGWNILDGEGQAVAILRTEALADVVMRHLTGLDKYSFDEGEPYGLAEEPDGAAPYRCQNCGHEEEESAFWSDIKGGADSCPECGSEEVFFKDAEGKE